MKNSLILFILILLSFSACKDSANLQGSWTVVNLPNNPSLTGEKVTFTNDKFIPYETIQLEINYILEGDIINLQEGYDDLRIVKLTGSELELEAIGINVFAGTYER